MSLKLLPDEVLHIIGHKFLEPPDILALGSTCRQFKKAFLTNKFDIDIAKSLYGVNHCVKNQWWTPARLALQWDLKVTSDTLINLCETEVIQDMGNCVKLVKRLITIVDPSYRKNTAIRYASRYGHVNVVKVLLEDSRVDPSDLHNMAIRYASGKGHVEVVKLLLKDPCVNPSAEDNWAIRYASNYGHVNVVKVLLEDSRINPSDMHNMAIRWASNNSHREVVKLLLTDPRVSLPE